MQSLDFRKRVFLSAVPQKEKLAYCNTRDGEVLRRPGLRANLNPPGSFQT